MQNKEPANVTILAVESSCDETSAAVVRNGRQVLSNVISSQIEIHKKFGGVVPEVASRKHIESINIVIQQSLDEAKVTANDLDAIAVTHGPGLVGALLVGINSAKALSYAWQKPLIAVNHIEGHIFANFLEHQNLEPPFVCLVVSGGHSHLVYVKNYAEYEILGQTRDDAAGEAYDKIARALGLGYPGGPLIDQEAKKGNKNAVVFPRVYLEDNSFDFSFSGLKSSVLNHLNSLKQKNQDIIVEDIAASFQEAVIEVLVNKAVRATKYKGCNTIVLAGGVAANTRLRECMAEMCQKNEIKYTYPSTILCTDNAAMIGCAAYYKYIDQNFANYELNAIPNLELAKKSTNNCG